MNDVGYKNTTICYIRTDSCIPTFYFVSPQSDVVCLLICPSMI